MKQIKLNINGNSTITDWQEGHAAVESLHSAHTEGRLASDSTIAGTLNTPIAPPSKVAALGAAFPDLAIETDETLVQFEDREVARVIAEKTGGGDLISKEAWGKVTSIGTWFQGNTKVTCLNELGYTNIGGIGSGYLGNLPKLVSMVLPSSCRSYQNLLSTTTDKPNTEFRYLVALQGNGSVGFQTIDTCVRFAPNLELIDFPARLNRGFFNYFSFQGCGAANFVIRSLTCYSGQGAFSYKGKNLFVPQSVIEDYKANSVYVEIFGDKIYEIGGDKWAEEFGSHDEWASYRKYGLDGFIGK